MFVFLDMFPLNQPEVMIARAEENFDSGGKLTDQSATQRIRVLLKALTGWMKSL